MHFLPPNSHCEPLYQFRRLFFSLITINFLMTRESLTIPLPPSIPPKCVCCLPLGTPSRHGSSLEPSLYISPYYSFRWRLILYTFGPKCSSYENLSTRIAGSRQATVLLHLYCYSSLWGTITGPCGSIIQNTKPRNPLGPVHAAVGFWLLRDKDG